MRMADPHVISALKAKRAELSGELIAAEKRILQLREYQQPRPHDPRL
jgi:hypothetical protein